MTDTPPPEPTPPEPPEPQPQPTPPPRPEEDEDSYDAQRRRRIAAEKKLASVERRLAQMEQANASEAEKALTSAREEGRALALREAGVRLAAAEFRAQATGKLAEPAAALEYLDLSRFVNEDGEPDSEGIGEAVDRLVAMSVPAERTKPTPPRVPNGVQPESPDTDWLRSVIRQG